MMVSSDSNIEAHPKPQDAFGFAKTTEEKSAKIHRMGGGQGEEKRPK
jgi:hypothetical protein